MSRIAIVGIGGIFPGALDLDQFWQIVSNGVDTGSSVPEGRWYLDPAKAYQPEGPVPDRVYSRWGCYIKGFSFQADGLNLDPKYLGQLDPVFLLGLHAARAAFQDAQKLSAVDLNRVGVILGNIALPTILPRMRLILFTVLRIRRTQIGGIPIIISQPACQLRSSPRG